MFLSLPLSLKISLSTDKARAQDRFPRPSRHLPPGQPQPRRGFAVRAPLGLWSLNRWQLRCVRGNR